MHINKFLSNLISGFLLTVRPLLGPANCRYEVSCMKFALVVLRQEPLIKALQLITQRVLSCHPFHR